MIKFQNMLLCIKKQILFVKFCVLKYFYNWVQKCVILIIFICDIFNISPTILCFILNTSKYMKRKEHTYMRTQNKVNKNDGICYICKS